MGVPVRRRLLILVLTALAVCAPPRSSLLAQGRPGLQSFASEPLAIRTGSGTYRFTVEVARSPAQHAQGLMFRRRLARDAGMLFLYRRVQPVNMWMLNTFIPLDMLFIAADGRIVNIVERTVPRSRQIIPSGAPIVAVLEVNGGTAARLKISVGDRIVHPAFAAGG